jgi:hypothetical protein
MDLGCTDVQSKAKQQRVKDTTKRRWRRWTENDVEMLRNMQKDGLHPQAISKYQASANGISHDISAKTSREGQHSYTVRDGQKLA